MLVLLVELLHTGDAHLIKRFKNVEGGKEEGTRAASGIENSDTLQGIVEILHKQVVLRMR